MGISERPDVVDTRQRFGHGEGGHHDRQRALYRSGDNRGTQVKARARGDEIDRHLLAVIPNVVVHHEDAATGLDKPRGFPNYYRHFQEVVLDEPNHLGITQFLISLPEQGKHVAQRRLMVHKVKRIHR